MSRMVMRRSDFRPFGLYAMGFGHSNTATGTVNIDVAGTRPGDLLVVLAASQGANSAMTTSSAGWSILGQANSTGRRTVGALWALKGQCDPLTLTGVGSLGWTTFAIDNWGGGAASHLKIAGSNSTNSNPGVPALSPGFGAYPWFLLTITTNNQGLAATYGPSGITGYNSSSGLVCSSGYRYLSSGNQAAATWTTASSCDWNSLSVGVRSA